MMNGSTNSLIWSFTVYDRERRAGGTHAAARSSAKFLILSAVLGRPDQPPLLYAFRIMAGIGFALFFLMAWTGLAALTGRLRTATISGQRRLWARVATIPLGYIASRSGIWVGRLEDRHFFRSLWQFRYTIRTFPLGEMTMAPQIRTAVDFYERHPISAQIILTKLEAARGTLDGLRPDELLPHDQDHYGGTPANDALAKCAHIGSGTKVVDLCAGLGGPARLRMYQKLRGEAEQAGAPAGHDDFYKSYVLFVSLVQQKIMSGARFAAVKPA